MFRRKKEAYKFSDRRHSIKGLLSFIMAVISFISLVTLCYISSQTAGNGGMILGVTGMVLCGFTVAGFVLGIKACKEKEVYYNAPVAGLVINGILSTVYLILYMVGITL